MAKHPKWTRRFLGMTDFDAVSDAIKAAESHTSAEIRVHLERRLPRRFFGARVDALEVHADLRRGMRLGGLNGVAHRAEVRQAEEPPRPLGMLRTPLPTSARAAAPRHAPT